MDAKQLEKQLSVWNKLVYMGLGSALTLLASSPNDFSYTGLVWLLILIVTTPSGFFLLFAKRWKILPLSKERINTALGYLLVSWLALFVPLTMGGGEDTYNSILLLYTVFLGFLAWKVRKKLTSSEEMFP